MARIPARRTPAPLSVAIKTVLAAVVTVSIGCPAVWAQSVPSVSARAPAAAASSSSAATPDAEPTATLTGVAVVPTSATESEVRLAFRGGVIPAASTFVMPASGAQPARLVLQFAHADSWMSIKSINDNQGSPQTGLVRSSTTIDMDNNARVIMDLAPGVAGARLENAHAEDGMLVARVVVDRAPHGTRNSPDPVVVAAASTADVNQAVGAAGSEALPSTTLPSTTLPSTTLPSTTLPSTALPSAPVSSGPVSSGPVSSPLAAPAAQCVNGQISRDAAGALLQCDHNAFVPLPPAAPATASALVSSHPGTAARQANALSAVAAAALPPAHAQPSAPVAAPVTHAPAASGSVTPSATVPAATVPSAVASSGAVRVTDMTVKRAPNGAARIMLSLSGVAGAASVRQEGAMVVADVPARLSDSVLATFARPEPLTDFDVPVASLSASQVESPTGPRAHLVMPLASGYAGRNTVALSSYQADNTLVIEIAPKAAAAGNDVAARGALSGAHPAAGSHTGIDPNGDRIYTGTRTSFNFQDVPVRSVLQVLADVSGVNLVASDSVTGNVTLRLSNVPWDQALDVIMKAKQLDMRREGNVIWIAPQTELAKYEQSLADARAKAADSAPLETSYIPLSYAHAKDIAKLLTTGALSGAASGGGAAGGGGGTTKGHGFLSDRGSVSFDERTNTLLLNDTQEQIDKLRRMIAILDRPVQQVLIEARVVIASDDFSKELGAKFGVNGNRTNANTQFQLGGSLGSTNGNMSGGNPNAYGAGGLNVNLGTTASPDGSIALGILGHNFALDLELDASQSEGKSETVSSPRVITANQQEADIRQGQEIGYVTYQNSTGGGGASGTATVQFKDAVLELKATPTITADGRVYLQIDVKKDNLDSYITVPGSGQVPIIDTQEVNTTALLDNGQTVVLGGIYQVTKSDTVAKVPGLGDIPILGSIFRHTNHVNDKAELLIFVTPKILNNGVPMPSAQEIKSGDFTGTHTEAPASSEAPVGHGTFTPALK